MSNPHDDDISNPSNNETLHEVVGARVSRRDFLGGGLASIGIVSIGGIGSLLPAHCGRSRPLLGFQSIPVSSADTVVVPPGYTAKVLIAWGDPVSNGPAFQQDASNTAADQALQWGMHNDGAAYFPIDGSKRGLLVQNHEYMDDVLLFPDGIENWTPEKTAKALAAHGVSIIEVRQASRKGKAPCEWEVVRPSKYARRITGTTPMDIGGPAAGDPRLITNADPTGRKVLGTLNNCAMGYTPWGTYLACEENFNGYFRANGPPAPGSIEARYGITENGAGFLIHRTDTRFTLAAEPNEPNRFGWVVEIDPFQPKSTPIKRTALGRLKHEGARIQETKNGRIVAYMGDDQNFEYIYRYVSNLPWRKALNRGVSPLDDGILYVARFNANGTGNWIPLTPYNPALAGLSLNDILINTRRAADLAGGTKMDRPEWIDTFPDELTGIATLSNNSRRGTGTNPPTDAANPRSPNTFGHIIRWHYASDWTETDFKWELFALGGDPANAAHGSTIVGDKYGSPDGIYVAPSGRLWIQTDVSDINTGAHAGFGNNQMLCADPRTRETRRFLVGPNGCEITGVTMTPDEKTMFVGIQHPGEGPVENDPADPKQFSSWPDGPSGGRPRSACVVITKCDGRKIGT